MKRVLPLLLVLGGVLMTGTALALGAGDRKLMLNGLIQIQLDDEQRRNVDIIESGFLDAQLPLEVAAAAVVNAYQESKLRTAAIGDGGHSVGLFQENDWGAGAGLSVADRSDPFNNVQVILHREVLANAGKKLLAAAAAGASVADLAGIFCRDVERPKDKAGEMAKRSALANKLFPDTLA